MRTASYADSDTSLPKMRYEHTGDKEGASSSQLKSGRGSLVEIGGRVETVRDFARVRGLIRLVEIHAAAGAVSDSLPPTYHPLFDLGLFWCVLRVVFAM